MMQKETLLDGDEITFVQHDYVISCSSGDQKMVQQKAVLHKTDVMMLLQEFKIPLRQNYWISELRLGQRKGKT